MQRIWSSRLVSVTVVHSQTQEIVMKNVRDAFLGADQGAFVFPADLALSRMRGD